MRSQVARVGVPDDDDDQSLVSCASGFCHLPVGPSWDPCETERLNCRVLKLIVKAIVNGTLGSFREVLVLFPSKRLRCHWMVKSIDPKRKGWAIFDVSSATRRSRCYPVGHPIFFSFCKVYLQYSRRLGNRARSTSNSDRV